MIDHTLAQYTPNGPEILVLIQITFYKGTKVRRKRKKDNGEIALFSNQISSFYCALTLQISFRPLN